MDLESLEKLQKIDSDEFETLQKERDQITQRGDQIDRRLLELRGAFNARTQIIDSMKTTDPATTIVAKPEKTNARRK